MILEYVYIDDVKTKLSGCNFSPKSQVIKVEEADKPLQFLYLSSSNIIGWNSGYFTYFTRSDWLANNWSGELQVDFQDLGLERIREFTELQLALKEEWLQELNNSPRVLLNRLASFSEDAHEYGQVMRVEEISLGDKLKQETWVFSWPLNSYAIHWMDIYRLWRFKQGLLNNGEGEIVEFYTEAEIQHAIWKQIKGIYKPMKPKVIHIKDAPEGWEDDPKYVYIGRSLRIVNKPTLWGNPHLIDQECPACKANGIERMIHLRGQTLPYYEADLRKQLQLGPDGLPGNAILAREIKALADKILVCFCKPKPCHGDVLARICEELNKATDSPLEL